MVVDLSHLVFMCCIIWFITELQNSVPSTEFNTVNRINSVSHPSRPRDASATSHPTNATRRNHFSTFLKTFLTTISKKHLFYLFCICLPLEGNFDIDAGDGCGGVVWCVCVWGGDHLGPPKSAKVPNNLKQS